MRLILSAVVGSQAYGLATDDSDVDHGGVFVVPTHEVLGVFPVEETKTGHDPDHTYHEVGKFIRLALKANPTVLELLFLDRYEVLTEEGELLTGHRAAFLSEPGVRTAFGGYAVAQVRKLLKREAEGRVGFGPRTKNRYAKHARHCFRLLRQGRELLETAEMSVRVEDPGELFAIGRMASDELAERFEREYADFIGSPSVLPPEPDLHTVNEVLLRIRSMNP